jgi:hypothetical protein
MTVVDRELEVRGFVIPAALNELAAEIERSRTILDLEGDWDEAGSPGYTEETWRSAIDLLVRIASAAWKQYRVRFETIFLSPGEKGSIDIELRAQGHELFITIPADRGQEATYYGDDGNWGSKQKGTFPLNKPNAWLAAWLAE